MGRVIFRLIAGAATIGSGTRLCMEVYLVFSTEYESLSPQKSS
jgi:hypothetical protein